MKRSQKNLLLYLGLGAAAYFFLTRKASAATVAPSGGAGVPMPTPVVAGNITPAPTASQVTAASSTFDSLPDAQGPTGGYVMFPSGSMADSVFLPYKQGPGGAVYTTWAGQVFEIGFANADGNYQATLVQ